MQGARATRRGAYMEVRDPAAVASSNAADDLRVFSGGAKGT